MSNKNLKGVNKMILGNYTKGAVESFEKNIANKKDYKDYLEKVNKDK